MWIRSQDKTMLLPANKVMTSRVYSDGYGREWYKIYYDYSEEKSSYNIIVLGEYAKKEDALNVLNELQSKLVDGNSSLYEMPYRTY